MKKVMILSPCGKIWATSEENFNFSDKEEWEKLKIFIINKGNCYGDCKCSTQGFFIGEK
jgi:hypothetical protein